MKLKKNIDPAEGDAIDVFLKGEEVLRAEHNAREISKIGDLRVGSAGCMVGESRAIGKCPQTALARALGHQLPTFGSQAYFDGGLANEEIWAKNAKASGVAFRCEEDIPVVHHLPSGTKITGRPDMVLGTEKGGEFTPEHMIELKACQATNSAGEKLLLNKPSADHVIQAATYSMFLGIPASLVYTSNVTGGIVNFFTKKAAGRADAPFGKIEFKLGWEDGQLYYMLGTERVNTEVTQDGILEYYHNIDQMARQKNHQLIYQDMTDLYGNVMPFNPRNYNDILNLVDEDLPFDQWVSRIEQVCKQPYLIKYRTKRNTPPWYEVIRPNYHVESYKHYKEDELIQSFESLDAARKFVYND